MNCKSNTWKHFTVRKKKEVRLVYECYLQNMFVNIIYLIDIYKKDLALNNLQWLICYKTKQKQTICQTNQRIVNIWVFGFYSGSLKNADFFLMADDRIIFCKYDEKTDI